MDPSRGQCQKRKNMGERDNKKAQNVNHDWSNDKKHGLNTSQKALNLDLTLLCLIISLNNFIESGI